ncbi:uncharacterized protein LOC111246188 isoform X3 [Varroa destructor]|uniref:ABC transporter domain-containing protein n=1 Tax=Varroa destructor TaxID=109461 RepID=A0A7M7JEZ7_VARDE|nr:uncharacterized protein LOC111246188 isoform X3 [Varroa destructor]
MKMWKALLMLLKKCNQIDPWRFFLNNFIVPLLLLTLWIIAENHNFVTVIPNIRFDAFSVSDPSQTQLYSPRMGALAVEVFAVENLFTNNHTRSHEDHGFPIEKIQQRLTQQLKDFGIRKSVGGGTDDVQVLVYRLNSTAYVSVFCQPALDTNSIFLFANLLLSNGPSLLQSRELDLVRDGSVFVMTQVAIVLADSSNVTNLPEVKIKIDDIHQRQIRSFSRDYYRLIPFVTIVLVGLRVVWLLARMQEELKDGSVVAFIAYAYPNILNTFAWLVTLVFEVILLELWIMGPLLMASCLSQTQNEFFAAKIRIDLLAFIILLYCVQEAVFVTWSICLFGKHASFFYGTITSIRLLIHMLHFYKKPLLCLDGSTSIFALLSGSYALEIGIKFATELNLPIPADTIDFMACAGKGKLDTLSYRAAVLAIIFWALFFYTGTIIVAYLPIRDGSFRPEVGTTLAGRIHCRRQTPNIDPSDVPLIQTFTKGTKLSLTMLGVTYENAEKYRVLNNFTLVIPRGQIVSLVGDVSDVGDAVLAILSGVCTKYEGLVTHCGQLADPDCLANNVSVCPVNFFLLNQMTIANNVKFFMSARNVTDAQQVFSALMKDLEMKAPLETTFEILSNSDKRKACIGIALLGLSDVVVLEEPTRDLSPEDAKKLVVLLQREARRRSVLLITTDSEFAESVSERVNVCFDGSVVFSGTVTALVSVLLDSVLVLDAEMPFTMVLHLRLPPRKNYEERQGNSNYSNLRLLDLIQTFPTGVKTIHISRQSIVLQVRGTDNQVQEVYDTLLAQQEDLNIQKITMADPSLHNALEAASDTKVTLALLGEQRQIHRNIRDKWNFCKRGLRDFGDRMSVETVLSQIQCTAYLWTLLFVRRGLLPNIMILLCILFLLDCLLFHAGHDLLMITQMHSFHKKLWGVYCNNESYLRSQNRDRILELFQDIKVPNVSSEPNQLGQVCLEITKNNTHILHAPVTNVRDLAVFLGRLYNAYFAPANRINWYYHETSHSNLIRLLANNLMALFWSSQFGYLLITTTLVTIDIYCFVCSHDFFNKARLLQAGLRKTAFWIGIITFAIIKNGLVLLFFEFRMVTLHMKILLNLEMLRNFSMKVGTVFLSSGLAGITSAFISTLPLRRWLRHDLLPMLLLINLVVSILLFLAEIFLYEMGCDVTVFLLGASVILPAYHMVLVLRRLHISIFLSKACLKPDITEIICPYYPALAKHCCANTCPAGDHSCLAWSIDAYSNLRADLPGLDRTVSTVILVVLHIIFYSVQILSSRYALRKTTRCPGANDPEVAAQMRLQKRQCHGFTRTTLFEGIAGILDFDDGSEVYISGRRIPLEFKHRTLIGVAHSTDRLPDQAIVEDYLNLFNTIREVPGPWQGYHLELVIRVFGLEDVRKMAIESISHSKRKLVAIASAFIGIPALIILNDPLDLVEAQDRERICNAINSLKSKDSIILVFSSSLDDALSLELDRAAVLAAGELVTIRTLPDLLSIDIGYHIIVRLNAPVVNDTKYANILRQQRDFVLKVLSAKFPYARLVLQAGALCEFHIRGKNVTCRNINEAKRTIIETLTSAQEIKIGYVSGKRRLLYLIDALTNKNHQADTI